MQTIFISGIGTGIGKTLVAAILAEALEADYWKPVQAGFEEGTDSQWVQKQLSNARSKIHKESYTFKLAASPHIASRQEGISIDLAKISKDHQAILNQRSGISEWLIVEGAGGLLVPLNKNEFVIDLIGKLDAKLIIVSRNYLGSINHSLLTAKVSKSAGLSILGWIFNDQYLDYESEIVQWSEFNKIASIPFSKNPDPVFVKDQAILLRKRLFEIC